MLHAQHHLPRHPKRPPPPPHRCVCARAAHPRAKQPPTPSPTPLDPSTAPQPAQLTLVETSGRQQTTHTWSLTGATSSSNSASSSQDDSSSSSSDSGQQSAFLYSQLQQQLPTLQQRQLAQSSNGAATSTSSGALAEQVSRLREGVSLLFLPAGYPASVTPDYLPYQLATIPAHVTGWLSISLTTSSLLKAVGIAAGPVGATAAAAAIKWIVKDGIGAAGRLLVGGRLGMEFDDDPRRWRMAAEALTTLGLSLEIATAIYPSQFLLLASLGNFSKAVGKGMGKPVFRVIQTHFAASGNVGAVAAKEEVWEVSAQLAGYSLSVLLLQQLQDAGSWQTVVGIWALVQGAHVGFRYAALKTLRFRYLNQKRAKLLVSASVRGQALPTVAQGNQQEPFFGTAADLAPAVTLGASLAEAWGVEGPGQLRPELLGPWWGLYEGEGYLLTWRQGRAAVVVKEEGVGVVAGGAGGGGGSDSRGLAGQQQRQQQVLLRALWQAAWLEAHSQDWSAGQQQQQHSSSEGVMKQQGDYQQQQQQQQQQEELDLLRASLQAVQERFGSFLQEAEAAGWRMDQLVLRVGAPRVQMQQLLSQPADLCELDV